MSNNIGSRITIAHGIAFEAVRDLAGDRFELREHTKAMARAMTIEAARDALYALSDAVKPGDLPTATYTAFQDALVQAEDALS